MSLSGCCLWSVNEFKLASRGSLAQMALHGHPGRRKLPRWAAEGRGGVLTGQVSGSVVQLDLESYANSSVF